MLSLVNAQAPPPAPKQTKEKLCIRLSQHALGPKVLLVQVLFAYA